MMNIVLKFAAFKPAGGRSCNMKRLFVTAVASLSTTLGACAAERVPGSLTVADFTGLPPNIDFPELARRIGKSGKNEGSGINIYVYQLSDGSSVRVGTPDQKKIFYIDHDGQRLWPIRHESDR